MPVPSDLVGRYLLEYLHGLNPYYWFRLDPEGLIRHMIKGYGYLWLPAAPFAFLGLILSLTRLRKPPIGVGVVLSQFEAENIATGR